MVQLKLSSVQLVAQAGQQAVAGVEFLGTQRAVQAIPASRTDRTPKPAEPTATYSDNPGPSGFMPDGHRAGRPASTREFRVRSHPRAAIAWRPSGPRAKVLARGSRVLRRTTCRMTVS